MSNEEPLTRSRLWQVYLGFMQALQVGARLMGLRGFIRRQSSNPEPSTPEAAER